MNQTPDEETEEEHESDGPTCLPSASFSMLGCQQVHSVRVHTSLDMCRVSQGLNEVCGDWT